VNVDNRNSFLIDNEIQINRTASVGIATFPEAAESSQELLRLADLTMYTVKKLAVIW
jgi:GGDEF domain-containing protein